MSDRITQVAEIITDFWPHRMSRAAAEAIDTFYAKDRGPAKVITLCGSTKFKAEFAEVNQCLTMDGHVVISLGVYGHVDLPDYDWTTDASDLKRSLDGLHFQKIRMADEVFVVDPGGYVGESTRREIDYAKSLGKPVRYLSATEQVAS